MHNYYLLLVISICLLYYLLFKNKSDKQSRIILIIGTISGMIASIGWILEELFPASKTLIKNIFVIPVFLALFVMFYLLSVRFWRMRKDPSKKKWAYLWFGSLTLVLIYVIVIVILSQLGVFG